jgi:hypothetical protein
MKGIKPHSHAERERIVRELVPQIRERFGDNLLAAATRASFARGDDRDYSDLELIIFLREMPDGLRSGGIGRIRDGMLYDIWVTTREGYLADVKKVSGEWYLAGSDTLKSIINDPFIAEVNTYQPSDLRDECLKEAVRLWPEVQESAAKVLNGIDAGNRDGLPLLLFFLLNESLAQVSLLNQHSFITLAQCPAQARELPLKPSRYDDFLDLMAAGGYADLPLLREIIIDVFRGFEELYEGLGIDLYGDGPIMETEFRYRG